MISKIVKFVFVMPVYYSHEHKMVTRFPSRNSVAFWADFGFLKVCSSAIGLVWKHRVYGV